MNIPLYICLVCRVNVIEKYKSSHPDLPVIKLQLLHYEAEHKDKLIACIRQHCNKVFIARPQMQLHYKRDHLGEREHCSYCSKSFSQKSALDLHLDKEHPEKSGRPMTFICKVLGCEDSFSNQKNLERHTRMRHEKKKKKPKVAKQCPICAGSFKHMNQHIYRVHEEFQPLSCPQCGKKLKDKKTLKIHVQTIHMNARETVPCNICGKVVSKKVLPRHIKMVHDQIRHECTQCEKSYAVRVDLNSHVRSVHLGIKSPCRFCHMEFQRVSDKNRHEEKSHPVELEGVKETG